MVLISGLENLLEWECLSLFGRCGYIKIIKYLIIKKISLAGYLPVHWYSSFMVYSSASGASQLVYRGLYMVEGHDERYFIAT
jgi:hypothetical protein